MLNWTREQLAERSGVSLRALNDFETGARVPRASTVAPLLSTFGKAGIGFIFIHDAEGGVIMIVETKFTAK